MDELEFFYYDNIEIKPNNEDHMKSLGERKVVFDTALELYKNLLGMYKTQYDKLKKTKKKKINTSS